MATGEENKGRGIVEKGVGKVKETTGELTGNKRLEAEGKLEGAKGGVREKIGDVQRKTEKKY